MVHCCKAIMPFWLSTDDMKSVKEAAAKFVKSTNVWNLKYILALRATQLKWLFKVNWNASILEKSGFNYFKDLKSNFFMTLVALLPLSQTGNIGNQSLHADIGCVYMDESRSERRFGTWSKTWLGSWFELRAFTWATNAFPITIRNCALRVIFCSYYAVRARWLTHALMHGFSAHFENAHARITFRNSFAFTWTSIRLSRRITIQNALFSAFQNAFQKPDLKQLFVYMG